MGHRLGDACVGQRDREVRVQVRGAQQLRAEVKLTTMKLGIVGEARVLKKHLLGQREPVGVQALGVYTHHHVARLHFCAVDQARPVEQPHAKACKIVLTGVVEPRQFGGFAAHERAT